LDRLSEKMLAKARSKRKPADAHRGPRKPGTQPSRWQMDQAVKKRVAAHRRRQTTTLLAIFLPAGIVVLALLVWLFWPVYTATGVQTSRAKIIANTITPGRSLPPYFQGADSIHVLFVGLDRDPPHRSDTVMLANLDLRTLQARVLSVPRDLRVRLPEGSYDKLAHAYVYGQQHGGAGAEWVESSLHDLLGVEVPYYVLINFDGFVKLVDALGGVDIDVEKPLKYVDHAQNLVIDIPEGRQHMDGEKLLKYVRFRHDAMGDIGRMQRQQKAMRAVLSTLKKRGAYRKLPSVLSALSETFETNFTLDQLTALARRVPDVEDEFIQTATVYSEEERFNGISYQITTDEWIREGVEFLENLIPQIETESAEEESNGEAPEGDAAA